MQAGAFEIDFNTLYFNNELKTKQLAISEYPSLQLANRQSVLNKAIEDIFNDKGDELMRPIFDTYNDNLHKAVTGVDEDTAKLLKNNLSRFAAAKSNYTIQLLERCKADADGVVRSKEEYQRAAKVVINRANSSQAVEYNTAVHRTRVCKQWKQFEEQRRLFPNIEWLRTRSASPRELHLSYVGRIWHMDDPFLQKNSPGCIWSCKCDWRNTRKPITENSDLTPVPVSPGLEGNPSSTNEVYTDKHPYFSRVDKHIPDLGVLYNPDEIAYINSVDANGKKFLEHYNCRFEKEYKQNLQAITELNKIGYGKETKLLPQIHYSQVALRERYYGKAFQAIQPNDCPDALINGKLAEFKSGTNKMASKRIYQASKKADIVYLELTEGMTDDYLNSFVKRQWANPDRQNIETLLINNKGKTHVFNRLEVSETKVFKTAKDINEAEKMAKDLGFKTVDFGGAKIEQINTILEAFHNEVSSSGKNVTVDKLLLSKNIKGERKGIVGGRYHQKTDIRGSMIEINLQNFQTNTYREVVPFKNQIKNISRKIESSEKTIEAYSSRLGKNKSVDTMLKKEIKLEKSRIEDYKYSIIKIERAIANGEKPIPTNVSDLFKSVNDQVKGIVHHEYGHHIDHVTGRRSFKDFKAVSKYGETSRGESFAEWYTHYKMIGAKEVPEDLLNIFKEWEKIK